MDCAELIIRPAACFGPNFRILLPDSHILPVKEQNYCKALARSAISSMYQMYNVISTSVKSIKYIFHDFVSLSQMLDCYYDLSIQTLARLLDTEMIKSIET